MNLPGQLACRFGDEHLDASRDVENRNRNQCIETDVLDDLVKPSQPGRQVGCLVGYHVLHGAGTLARGLGSF